MTVEFVNTRNAPVETGISLDSLPYILLLAGVVIGIVVLIARRRREDER